MKIGRQRNTIMTSVMGKSSRFFQIPKYETTTQTLLEDFENYSSWTKISGVDPVDDAVNFTQGTHSVRMTNVGAGTWWDKSISFTLTASQTIGIDLYYHAGSNPRSQLLFSATSDFSKAMTVSLYIPTIGITGWYHFEIGPNDISSYDGGMTWTTAVIKVRVRSFRTDTDNSHDNLTKNNTTFTPAVMFTFDDGWDSIYSLGFPIFSARHMRATVYQISSFLDTTNYLTTAYMLELFNDGWTIGNHTQNHTGFSGLTDAQIQTALSDCESDLRAKGITGNGPKHVSYPGGQYTVNGKTAMIAQGSLTGRMNFATLNGPYAHYASPNYFIQSVDLSSTTSLATAKGYVDAAISKNKVLTFMGHKLAASASSLTWATSDLAALLDYILSKNIPVITMDDYYNLYNEDVTVRMT